MASIDTSNDDDWYHKEMNEIAAKKERFFTSNCRNQETSTHCKERNRCMKCNEGGKLLICSSKTCSFVFHDSCLVSKSDTKGKFYCPFCIYSQLLSEYWIFKKKASLARNDVASFNGLVLKNIPPQMSHKRLCVSEQIKPCTTLSVSQKRRVPVPWTQLEEDTLKKWVEKFSQGSDGGFVPWRRILELGVSVFQKGRTPVDLKDKWRNMQKATQNST
ncbi:hypothetical protein L2E82_08182 [Cichorium intybus]|uniref:Uncharacterized protein n=1 Tax=Cichorium intybus TaxID=13427 RepID=A0ACB9G7Q6_CICIN|nr:hypothetical protein L2E82_08182 [Cichorium intybus]